MVLSLKEDIFVTLLANSHIDIAWLWSREETKRVCRETFENALFHMEKYGITYAQSNMIFYEWIEKEHPDLFEKIRRAISKGKWEVVGGSWVEFDANMPMGESLIRQFIIGKRYIREKFGVDVEICWLPDTFGFSRTLPKILRSVGIKYFLTSKLSWNDTTEFPYNIFIWRGDDGSEVLAYLTPHSYEAYMSKREVLKAIKEQIRKQKLPRVLFLYGRGDHGGGPTPEEAKNAYELSREGWIEIGKAIDFFEEVESKYLNYLPIWDDELYLQFHRGVFTTQLVLKDLIRRSEVGLLDLETLIAYLRILGGHIDLGDELVNLWKEVLTKHFHDVFAGTLAVDVTLENIADLIRVVAKIRYLKARILREIAKILSGEKQADKNLLVLNTLPWERTVIVKHPETGELLVVRNIPGFGYKIVKPDKKLAEGTLKLRQNGKLIVMENKRYVVFIDRLSGLLAQIYDKKLQRKLLAGPVELRVYDDDPNLSRKSVTGIPAGLFDAWEIFIYDRGRPRYISLKASKVEISEVNEARISVRAIFEYSSFLRKQLVLAVTYSLSDEDKINVDITMKSRAKHKFIKLVIPIADSEDYAIYGAPYGYVRRRDFSSQKATEEEKAKYEVPSVGWVLVPMKGGSLIVAADNRFGFSKDGRELQVSLLKTPTYPSEVHYKAYLVLPEWAKTPSFAETFLGRVFYKLNKALWKYLLGRFADQGNLRCKIVLASSDKREPMEALKTWRELLTPPYVATVSSEPRAYQLIRLDANTIYGHLKPSDDNSGFILRIVNYSEKEKELIICGDVIKELWDADVFENRRSKISPSKTGFKVTLGRNEIKTLILVSKDASQK